MEIKKQGIFFFSLFFFEGAGVGTGKKFNKAETEREESKTAGRDEELTRKQNTYIHLNMKAHIQKL